MTTAQPLGDASSPGRQGSFRLGQASVQAQTSGVLLHPQLKDKREPEGPPGEGLTQLSESQSPANRNQSCKRKQSASKTACALYCTGTIHNKSKRKHCLSVWNVLSQVLTCDPLLCFTCFSSPKSTSFSSFDWPGPAGRESLEDVSRQMRISVGWTDRRVTIHPLPAAPRPTPPSRGRESRD